MTEAVQKLLAALRSGEFAQTNSVLRDETGYCCLGVACEVYKRETGDGAWKVGYGNDRFNVGGHESSYTLPEAVREWLGFSHSDGEFEGSVVLDGRRFATLVELNDAGTVSFAQIADVIESEPDGLFAAVDIDEPVG